MTREETLRRFKSWAQRTLGNYCSDEDYHMANNIIALLEQEPKTGHWIYICNSEVNGLKIVKCSECGNRTYGSGKYCPDCGAKMKGE